MKGSHHKAPGEVPSKWWIFFKSLLLFLAVTILGGLLTGLLKKYPEGFALLCLLFCLFIWAYIVVVYWGKRRAGAVLLNLNRSKKRMAWCIPFSGLMIFVGISLLGETLGAAITA